MRSASVTLGLGFFMLSACSSAGAPATTKDGGAGDADAAGPFVDAASRDARPHDAGAPEALAPEGSVRDAAKGDSGGAHETPRGVYVPTFNRAIEGPGADKTLQALLTNPDVDGFFVSRLWSDVESTEGTYDFGALLADIDAVGAAGKRATVGIGAGMNAPPYVCTAKSAGGAGASCLSLVVHPPQQTGACIHETLPLPWDAVLQARFGAMIGALASAIAADPAASAAVLDVKITGFNDRNEETILPGTSGGTVSCTTGDACTSGQCVQTDAIMALTAAGYSDSTASSAIVAFADVFRGAFPGLPIGAQVSPGLPNPGSDNVHVVMDQALLAKASLLPMTFQNQGLSGSEPADQGLMAAAAAGAPIGFQMLAYVANNPTCLMGKGLGPGKTEAPCDESVLDAAITNGEAMGAQWLEIYEEDVVAYPSSITSAHTKLTK